MQEIIKNRWNSLIESKMRNIKTLQQLEAEDENVKNILKELRTIYSKQMDAIHDHELLNIGGKLLGLYASIGVTTANKRAERDAIEQSYEELLAARTLENKVGETNITEARAMAKDEMSEITGDLITKEQAKNAYEAITDAAEKTITFIQSAMRVKQSERASVNKFGQENV